MIDPFLVVPFAPVPDDKAARIAALRAQRDAIDAEILRLSREAVADIAEAAGLKGAGREFFINGLQPSTKPGTIDTMDATIETHATRISRARITKANRKHPFVVAFLAKGQTAHAAAAAIGYPRTTMQSWYRTGEHARPIPRAAVDAIKKLYGVPASAWPRITE